jgi:hypothetical protein
MFQHPRQSYINKPDLAHIRENNMVQALVEIDENTNRVLNVVKAKYGFKDKGKAIELVVTKYIDQQNEPELRPEFIKKLNQINKQKNIPVKDFAGRYGLKS